MSDAISSADLAHWREWIGREEIREQRLDVESLRRYAVAIGEAATVEEQLPSLAHWAWFLPVVATAELGEDGHPKRGGFLPPVSLPRRMFAASLMRFPASLQLAALATLTSTIADVRYRTGLSGHLVFVAVDRRIAQDGRVCVEERQTIVYRDAGGRVQEVADAQSVADGALWTPTSVDLFRFSAVTFNSHRIHYDRPYATGVEGYPDLVVHAPFTAARLFCHARAMAGRAPSSFAFRAQAPLFVSRPVRFVTVDGEHRALRSDGQVAMTAATEFPKT